MGYFNTPHVTLVDEIQDITKSDFMALETRKSYSISNVINEYIGVLWSVVDVSAYNEMYSGIESKYMNGDNRLLVSSNGVVFACFDMGGYYVVAGLPNFTLWAVQPNVKDSFPKGRLVFHIPEHGDFKGRDFEFDNQ